jgi:hypothetical protein
MTRVTATFSFWSKILRPEVVSEMLFAVPDRIVLRGADRDFPRAVPDAFGWHITCCDTGQLLIEDTLIKLLARVADFSGNIPNVKRFDPSLDIKISVSISPYNNDISLFFSAKTIVNIAELGSSFDIDFFD